MYSTVEILDVCKINIAYAGDKYSVVSEEGHFWYGPRECYFNWPMVSFTPKLPLENEKIIFLAFFTTYKNKVKIIEGCFKGTARL